MIVPSNIRVKPSNTLLFDATGKEGTLVDILDDGCQYKYVVELKEHPWLLTLCMEEFEVTSS